VSHLHTRDGIATDLRDLGLTTGDIVMVHASLRAIGEVAGGPDQVHLAVKDVIGTTGTMLMYASCPRYVDEVGRGHLTPDFEKELLAKLPAFDAETARSARDNGALVECLRTWPGSRVNHHPARFVAWGRLVDQLVSEQPWDFAFGRGSALERFTQLDGRILLLGAQHDNVTWLHYVEHVTDFPDKRIVRFKVPVIENGTRVWREMAEIDTGDRAHANWPDGFFARIVDGFLSETGNAGGMVGGARSFLLGAQELEPYAATVMQRVAGGGAA
jgi:aminoglycoside 3-N-acetyltransferase